MKTFFSTIILFFCSASAFGACYSNYNESIKKFAMAECGRATLTHVVADCNVRQTVADNQNKKGEFTKSFSWTCVNSEGVEWVRVGHLDISSVGEYAAAGLEFCDVGSTRCYLKGWSTGPTDVIK